jgi:Terminase large subunit, T4likevirus-type, N-terminal/Terminase RNaseH-like domain
MNSIETEEGEKAHFSRICWTRDPLPSQTSFQALPERFKGFSGPVGSGKSAALCFEALSNAYINEGRHGMLSAPTFAMLRDASQRSLAELLDEQDVEFELKKSDGELVIKAPASVILLRSLDEPERLRGTNLAWFGIDELSYASEEAWVRLEARLRDPKAARLCGFAVWTPQGHDWIYRRFIHTPVAGYGCVRAKPFENRFLLEGTPDYYERLESSYDPKFFRQEALGEYVNSRADRVYHCFNQAVHVIRQSYDPRKPLMWALDFNVAPMSSVLLQRDGDRLAVIDEIVLDRATTEEACMEFENRYKKHAGGLEIYGDASGRSMHTTGSNDYTLLQGFLYKAGFRDIKVNVPPANPPVLSRAQKVNALLTNALGEVRLEVDPRCGELIADFEEVMFKKDSGVIDKVRDPRRTHASDALGYAVWQLFGDKPKMGEINKRLF